MCEISAKVIAVTQPWGEATTASSPEDIVSYCARVSNPGNQENFGTSEKLLKYCIKNSHWSVFEMATAIVEVGAPRDITRQLLRHKSFSFQEFSQRYSDQIEFTNREFRLQDNKNRQNSIETDDEFSQDSFYEIQEKIKSLVSNYYRQLRDPEISCAKEVARVILPEGLTMSRLYVSGTLRSWIHYLGVRTGNGTQKEHIILANKIKEALMPVFPTVLGIKDVDL